jgi:rubrerythrin
MSQTEKNLQAAFGGESQANRKYLAFAKKADEEGQKGVAQLFRAAAAAETVHAHNHLSVLKGVNSTLENLQSAYEGEHYEFSTMYPEFLETSKKDGASDATQTFHWANEVEKVHGQLYQRAIEGVKAREVIPERDYCVCQKCGYTAEDSAPDKCPVCGADKDVFSKV